MRTARFFPPSILIGVLLCVATPGVRAAVFTIDRSDDTAAATGCDDAAPNDCSLRGAIIKANTTPGADTINFPAGTYTLTIAGAGEDSAATGDLDITSDLTIEGAGAATTVIDGVAGDRVFHVDPSGGNSKVSISGVTIQNGSTLTISFVDPAGGGILIGSTATAGDPLIPSGTLTLTDCIVQGNFSANFGGGIANKAGMLILIRSRVSNNASSGGGGIGNRKTGTTTVIDSTINNNSAGGQGGGILNFDGRLTVLNSTVSGNTSSSGNGIESVGPLTMTNSTVSGNTGAGVPFGGGLLLWNSPCSGPGPHTLNNNTITNNGSSGIAVVGVLGGCPVSLSNNIIAGNAGPDCYGTFNSQGYNLIQKIFSGVPNSPPVCSLAGNTTGNIIGQDPQLGLLLDNGGPTPTHALANDSPAVEAGNPAEPGSGGNACAALDQRGFPRPSGARCDIGAFERAGTFSLARVLPNTGGNAGNILAFVAGSGFVSGATVKLRRVGQPDILGSPVKVEVGGAALAVTFDLLGQAPGPWDVVVTNPNGTSQILAGGFTIEASGTPQVWADVVGPNFIRVTRPARFYIYYGNHGNIDAFAVPLLFTVSPKNIAVNFRTPFAPPPPQAGQVPTDWSQVAIAAAEQESTYIPVVLPVVPAGFTGVLEVSLTPAALGNFEVRFGTQDPYFQQGVRPVVIEAMIEAAISYARDSFGVEIPPALIPELEQYATTQLQSVVSQGRRALAESVGMAGEVYSLPQLVIDLAQFAVAQVGATAAISPELRRAKVGALGPRFLFPPNRDMEASSVNTDQAHVRTRHGVACLSRWIARAFSSLFLPSQAHAQGLSPQTVDCTGLARQGGVLMPGQSLRGGGAQTARCTCRGPRCGGNTGESIGSRDPNDKVGSRGVGTAQYVAGNIPLRYGVFFENVETATAPAQEVVITDQLDSSKVDFDTFSLGPISFGEKTAVPPPGLSQYRTSVDLRPARNLLVRIDAGLDTSTGIVTWRLTSVDPETLQFPEDPLAGFLPPNVNPPEGDGAVMFTVKHKSNLSTGTTICNQATIVFDANAAIDTPRWCNTLDDTKPQSEVLPLAATQASPTFQIQWTGTDTGSGIGDYSIFVSENGGPFSPFVRNATDTSATFTGKVGSTYAFYSVARDLTGNEEQAPGTPDAITQISLSACAVNITPQVSVTRSGFRRVSSTGRYVQQITLKNIGTRAVSGPVSLALDNLSNNAALFNKSGDTSCATPTSPHKSVEVGADDVLSPGETAVVVLEFANPSNQNITYTTRLLGGTPR